jgi:hypothetical protein
MSSFLAGLTLAVPFVLKVTPLLPVTFVVAQRAVSAWYPQFRRTELARAASSAIGFAAGSTMLILILPATFVGWQANLNYLGYWWDTIATHEEDSLVEDFAGDNTSERNQSFVNAAARFGDWLAGHPEPAADQVTSTEAEGGLPHFPMQTPFWYGVLLVVRILALCLLVAVCINTGRSLDPLKQTVGVFVACLSQFMVCQIARGHYFAIWLPMILFATLWMIQENMPKAGVWLAWSPVALVLAHYAFLDEAGRIGLLGLGTTAWYVVICTLLLRSVTVGAELESCRLVNEAKA